MFLPSLCAKKERAALSLGRFRIEAFHPPSDPSENVPRNSARFIGQLLGINRHLAVTTNKRDHLSELYIRDIGYVHNDLVHCDAPADITFFSMYQNSASLP